MEGTDYGFGDASERMYGLQIVINP